MKAFVVKNEPWCRLDISHASALSLTEYAKYLGPKAEELRRGRRIK